MKANIRSWIIRIGWLPPVVVAAAVAWVRQAADDTVPNVASGNGRIEAVEIDIAARLPGRVREILVREGDPVAAGQVLARMDTAVLEAQLREAEARLRQAGNGVATARSEVVLREAEKVAAEALLAQRTAEWDIARKRFSRSSRLAGEGATSEQDADDDSARMDGAAAAVGAARARLAAAEAAIATARSQVVGAESAEEASSAAVERVRADIDDCALQAPRAGRVQYLVARAGEVVGAGGRVVNLVDLSDVYMTFFLSTAEVGRVALGSEARLVLDAAPEHVIPARISFVADVAQFTPKTVETAVEREKLMFRVRAQIPADLLGRYTEQVKAGLPGVAHVRLDPKRPWPAALEVKLP